MGLAGPIYELFPPRFQKLFINCRCREKLLLIIIFKISSFQIKIATGADDICKINDFIFSRFFIKSDGETFNFRKYFNYLKFLNMSFVPANHFLMS